MASKRDKLKQLNNHSNTVEVPEQATTIVDELAENYANNKSEQEAPAPEEANLEPVKTYVPDMSGELINVIDKSHVGRPKILEGVYKPISARLKMENYEHARKVGGRFGGMNAYINYLIEQDIQNSQR